MPAKLTINQVREIFKNKNCEFLDEIYLGVNFFHKFKCSCENIATTTVNNFRKYNPCTKCNPKKFSLHQIQKIYEEQGCKFDDDFYVDSSYLHNYTCKCGHKSKIRLYNFRYGKRCRKCAKNYMPTLEEVKELFIKENCVFLDSFYKNNNFIHNYRCKCGNYAKTSVGNFKAGKRCFKCSGSIKKDIEEVKKTYLNFGCVFLDDCYKGVNFPHNYRCSCGNTSKKSLSWIKKGSRCYRCSGKEKLTLDDVKKRFAKRNCEFLDNFYVNVAFNHNYKCSCGTISKISVNSFRSGRNCSKCALYGIDYTEKSYLYLISQPNKYKIGICNITSDRLKNHQNNGWSIIEIIEFNTGHEAHDEEQRIKKQLKKQKINIGKEAFREKFDGYTEAWNAVDLQVNSFEELYESIF
jgi:predicted GIY-YIG superfamily endonuclease